MWTHKPRPDNSRPRKRRPITPKYGIIRHKPTQRARQQDHSSQNAEDIRDPDSRCLFIRILNCSRANLCFRCARTSCGLGRFGCSFWNRSGFSLSGVGHVVSNTSMATKEMRKFSNVSAKSCFSNLEMKLRQKPGRGGIAGELCKGVLM